MQATFSGHTAQQIIKAATTDANGQQWITIDGISYQITAHGRVELANGNWAKTVVLQALVDDQVRRIVLEA